MGQLLNNVRSAAAQTGYGNLAGRKPPLGIRPQKRLP